MNALRRQQPWTRHRLLRWAALIAVTGAVIAGAPGCGKSSTPNATTTTTPSASTSASASTGATASPAQPATPANTTGQAPVGAGPTRVPCELLTPSIAKTFAGQDAVRQLSSPDPPVPVGDDACYYRGSTGSVYFSIGPIPTDPSAPVNHFGVIKPENQIPGLAYTAYWFGPGESLLVVKNGLLLTFGVGKSGVYNLTPDIQADDLRLADLIVPRVG